MKDTNKQEKTAYISDKKGKKLSTTEIMRRFAGIATGKKCGLNKK